MTTTAATAIGIMLLTVMGSLAVQLVPDMVQPIKINSMTYSRGMVTIDRTITTNNELFFMRKSGQVINRTTGDTVPGCDGIKSANFRAGRTKVTVTLEEWIGNTNCTPAMLTPGDYALQAVYIWGDHQAAFIGAPFTIPEVDS